MKAVTPNGKWVRPLNFHDDALAVIASRNRVSVWRDYYEDDETPESETMVCGVRTKRANPRYL